MKLIICAVTPPADVIWSRRSGGVEMLTAMTTSPHSRRASSIGRLSASPPSTSRRPSISTGAITPGTDMLARIACATLPLPSATAAPVSRSVATARNGTGSLSKSVICGSRLHHLAEEGLDRHAGDHALRQGERAVAEPDFEAEQRLVVVDLATDRGLAARRPVAKDLRPVGRSTIASISRVADATGTAAPRGSRTVPPMNRAPWDAIVIGAGAAGMMCAAVAGQRGARVLLIDHAEKLAEKIRISGGGRCNFTNVNAGPANFISENPAFCRSALARYRRPTSSRS